jgi:DNA-binding SARP family transcriptional activator
MSVVRVDLLGPLEVSARGQAIAPGGPKLRAVIAQLALAGGRVVSAEELMYGVWGDDLPSTARNTLQYHVGVLRKGLAAHGAASAVLTRDPGYALAAGTDVAEFAAGVAAAERHARAGEHDRAAAAYVGALDLWRGHALGDLRDFGFAVARGVALEEQRLLAWEGWADAELACGRADALVAPLQDLVTEHPTRERLWEQLMIAFYRTGRQDAALSAYQAARTALDRDLGVDPSAALVALQRAILTHDPMLSPHPVLRPMAGRQPVRTVLPRSEAAGSPMLVGPSGQRIVLGPAPVLIGRQQDCDLVLPDEQASRRHARVTADGDGYVLEDVGSTNGTYLDGSRVAGPVRLTDGNRIEIGHCVVRFVARG